MEWDGPINDDVGTVEVPSTECPLQNETWELLSASIDPLNISDVHGVDIYLETIRLIQNRYSVDVLKRKVFNSFLSFFYLLN